GLHTLALALDDVHVHHHGVARREVGDFLLQALDLFLLQCPDQIHVHCSRLNSSSSISSSLPSGRAASRSGRLSHVLPSACFSRQRRMFSWWPESSTSGTRIPAYTSGRVYCGQSSSPPAKDSSSAEASSPSAPGSCRTHASISAIAA